MSAARAELRGALPFAFGDDRSRELYLAKIAAVRARLHPGSFFVAPECRVRTARGELGGGELISPADIHDEVDYGGELVASAAFRWATLVRSGRVMEVF